MQEIKEWFKNKSYAAGVSLYQKYGTSDFLKQLFSTGSNSYTQEALEDALSELLDEQPADKTPEPVAPPTPPVDPQTHPLYLKLCRDRDQVFRQIDRNMMLLDSCRTDSARHRTALQIIRLQRRKREIFAELDYLEEHGAPMPPVPVKEVKTPEIQRLYVQISKAKKRLQNPELRNRTKTERLLEQKQARLAELRRERLES